MSDSKLYYQGPGRGSCINFAATAQMLSGISRPRPRRTKPVFYIEGQLRTDKVPSNVAKFVSIASSIYSVIDLVWLSMSRVMVVWFVVQTIY